MKNSAIRLLKERSSQSECITHQNSINRLVIDTNLCIYSEHLAAKYDCLQKDQGNSQQAKVLMYTIFCNASNLETCTCNIITLLSLYDLGYVPNFSAHDQQNLCCFPSSSIHNPADVTLSLTNILGCSMARLIERQRHWIHLTHPPIFSK